MDSTIIKTLVPGKKGTRQLVQKYGEALLCVRYRVERQSGLRYKTVEIIEKSWVSEQKAQAGELELAESSVKESEPGDAKSLPQPGELDSERMFWFRFRGYLPDLFHQVMEAGGRRGVGRHVWGLPWAKAEALGLLESEDVRCIDVDTLTGQEKPNRKD